MADGKMIEYRVDNGVAVGGSNPHGGYTIKQGKGGGAFRSDDGGQRWERGNDGKKPRPRRSYYMEN